MTNSFRFFRLKYCPITMFCSCTYLYYVDCSTIIMKQKFIYKYWFFEAKIIHGKYNPILVRIYLYMCPHSRHLNMFCYYIHKYLVQKSFLFDCIGTWSVKETRTRQYNVVIFFTNLRSTRILVQILLVSYLLKMIDHVVFEICLKNERSLASSSSIF